MGNAYVLRTPMSCVYTLTQIRQPQMSAKAQIRQPQMSGKTLMHMKEEYLLRAQSVHGISW